MKKLTINRRSVARATFSALVGRVLAMTSLLAVAVMSNAATFFTDFNSGLPAGTTVDGSAFVDTSGGFSGTGGVLKLTTAFSYGQLGWFIMQDLDAGNPITGFSASFKLQVGGGEGADGFSFNFANDLPDTAPPYAEEGTGTGVTVEFDTYDNGGGEAPAIDIKAAGAEIATSPGNLDLFRTGDYVDVAINWLPDGTLNVTVNGTALYSGLLVPLAPMPGRFGLGARTGGLSDNHWVDNLSITTTTALPAHPVVRAVSPSGNGVRGDANIVLTVLNGATTQLKTSSVKLTLNGAAVTPTVTTAGSLITVSYQPPHLLAPGSANTLVLTYSDTAGQSYSFSSSFQVAPYVGPTGNTYEIVLVPGGISWPDANTAAQQRTYAGHHGHLATITGPDEDLYLENLRELSPPSQGLNQVWVGGYQLLNQATPNDGWFWVNNEGPISGYNGVSTYANWHPGEPNDYGNTTYVEDNEENYLAIGIFNQFGWNDDGNVLNGDHGKLYGYAVEYEAQLVPIDIKPNTTPNTINLTSVGRIPVAILSSATFNASTVDPATITFGHSGTEAVPVTYSLTDVNGDGLKDLVCQFNTQDAGFMCGDTIGYLRAKTKVGWPIHSSDSVVTQPCPPFTVSLQAMQDVHKLTDVYLTVNVVGQNCAPPVVSPHVLLQSIDLLGHVRWATNSLNVPLTPNPNNSSTGDLQYTTLQRYQKFQAQVQVQSCINANTLVLRQQGVVLLRPDVAVTEVDAPASTPASVVVNISAMLAELNGDLGANGTVYLMEGTTVLDQVSGFIAPKTTVAVVFSTVFNTLGTHNLKVVVANENPADYDTSNNEKDFTIQVTQQPAYYYAYYDHYRDLYTEDYNWPWWQSGTNYQNVNSEYLTEYLYIPGALNFPLDDVSVGFSADGVAKDSYDLPNLAADYSYPGYAQAYRHLADGVDFYVYTYNYPYYQFSFGQISRSAADAVYYSEYHNIYWGDGTNSNAFQYGTFLKATSTAGVRLVIQSSGTGWGGTISIPVYIYSWDNPFDYEDPSSGAYDRGDDLGSDTSGYNSGYVTP